MVAPNHNHWFQRATLNPAPPARRLQERLLDYFDQHPEVSREDFLLRAIQKEINVRSPDVDRSSPVNARPQRPRSIRPDNGRRPAAQDTHIHSWLADRVALVNRRRHSWRETVRRILLKSFFGRPGYL